LFNFLLFLEFVNLVTMTVCTLPFTFIVYVFLSNRTFPSMNNSKLSDNNVRTEIQRIIYDSLK